MKNAPTGISPSRGILALEARPSLSAAPQLELSAAPLVEKAESLKVPLVRFFFGGSEQLLYSQAGFIRVTQEG